MKLIIIRHGWIKDNEKGILCGVTDPSLSAKGKNELEELVKTYSYIQAEAVFSSPLKRCIETSKIIYPEVEIETIEELKEMNFGIYDGKSPHVLWGDLQKLGKSNDMDYKLTEGESQNEVIERMQNGFDKIIRTSISKGFSTIAVVGHSRAISLLLNKCITKKLTREELFTPNGMGFLMEVDEKTWEENKKMIFSGHVPEGAPRPNMSESPYMRKD